MEATVASPSVGRAKLNRVMRAIECKSKMILIALSIGVLGLATTVSQAEPSMQQQLETLQRQLEQQQRMIQEMSASSTNRRRPTNRGSARSSR